MTTTINASTSSGLVVTPDNSGNVLLQYNGQSAPAFSAYGNALVSSSSGNWAKIIYTTEDYDTNNNFASSRFTPTVAGYYQLNATIYFTAIGVAGPMIVAFYKNGSEFLDGQRSLMPTGTDQQLCVSGIIYCNGSTDYVEVYGYQQSGTMNIGSSNASLKFTGCLLRGA